MAETVYGKRYSMTNLRAGALSRRTDGEEYPEYTSEFLLSLAESYGAKGIRVMKKEDIAAAFEEAKKNTKYSDDHRIYHRSGGDGLPDDQTGRNA